MEIDIPFGAKDSELKGWRYKIPEGYTAEIKDGEIIVKETESDDERIRQELVKYIEDYPNLPSGHYSRADFFAYLEKQKPKWSEDKFPKNIEADAVQFCFDNGINITPYQAKQIATHYLMVGHNEGYIEGRKNAHIPAKELGLPSSMDFRQEWSEEDEEIFNLTITHLLSYAYPNNPIYRKEAEKCVAWLKSFRLQPKKEWSEEDETTLECSDPFKRFVDMVHSVDKDEFTEFEYSIINFVMACCDKNIAMTPKGIHRYAKTILNIVKKEFPSKVCGWTDEEETVLHNACEFIRHRLNDNVCRNGNIGGMDYKVLYEKLNSLRPHPRWKPSEEQMEALGKARFFIPYDCDVIAELYEQLQKLM